MAERVGFEPTDAFTSTVFKTVALSHSATSPIKWWTHWDLNPDSTDYESGALTIKLCVQF